MAGVSLAGAGEQGDLTRLRCVLTRSRRESDRCGRLRWCLEWPSGHRQGEQRQGRQMTGRHAPSCSRDASRLLAGVLARSLMHGPGPGGAAAQLRGRCGPWGAWTVCVSWVHYWISRGTVGGPTPSWAGWRAVRKRRPPERAGAGHTTRTVDTGCVHSVVVFAVIDRMSM